MIQWDNVSG